MYMMYHPQLIAGFAERSASSCQSNSCILPFQLCSNPNNADKPRQGSASPPRAQNQRLRQGFVREKFYIYTSYVIHLWQNRTSSKRWESTRRMLAVSDRLNPWHSVPPLHPQHKDWQGQGVEGTGREIPRWVWEEGVSEFVDQMQWQCGGFYML